MAQTLPSTEHRPGLQRQLLTLNFVAAIMVILAIAVVPTGTRVVVVAPPWSGPERVMSIIGEAGGTLVNGGRADWLAVAEGSSPDFAKRLMAAGALAILNGRLAAACTKGQTT